MTLARVDVAIPTRGRPAWCVEAVRSALAQEGVDVRVVVALDGPQPDLAAALRAVADPRLVVVERPPAGRSATRNAAVAATTAPLVAFLDDDDRLLPGALAARAEALARFPQAVLVHGPAVATDEDGAARRGGPRVPARATASDAACGDGLGPQLRGRSPVPSTVLLRREVFERVGGFPEDLETGEDWLFFLRAAAVGAFVTLAAPTVLYRRHAGQVRGNPAMQERALAAWSGRFFDDPRTPPAVRARRDRVVARHLAWIARNHRRAGDEAAFRRCFLTAVRLDPRLLLHPRRFARWVALRAGGRA
ncbi:MAG: glycosyltransferase family A protein [Planctomycetota bacterium]